MESLAALRRELAATGTLPAVEADALGLGTGGGVRFGGAVLRGSVKGEDVVTSVFQLVEQGVVCGGFIGRDGTRFCCSPASDCNVRSHSSAKCGLSNGYYIKAGKGTVALLEPMVTEEQVPFTLRPALNGLRTLTDWVRVFTALQEVSSNELLGLTVTELLAENTGKVTFGPMKTPKKRAWSPSSDDNDDAYSFGDVEGSGKIPRLEGESTEAVLTVIKTGWNRSASVVESLQAEAGEVNRLLKELDARTQLLHAIQRIGGTGVDVSDEMKAATARQSDLLDQLGRSAADVAGKIEGHSIPDMAEDVDRVKKRQESLNADLYSFKVRADLVEKDCKDAKEVAAQAVELLKELGNRWRSDRTAHSGADTRTLKYTIGRLDERLSEIEEHSGSLTGGTGDESWRAPLADMDTRMKTFERRSKAQGWEKGGFAFGTLEDVRAFVKLNLFNPGNGGGGGDPLGDAGGNAGSSHKGRDIYIGCFLDIFSALECVKVGVTGETADSIRMIGDLRRAGISGGVDAAIVEQSFIAAWPGLLHKAGSVLTGLPLNQIKTQDQWENLGNHQGIAPIVNENLETVLGGAHDVSAREFYGNPAGMTLVNLLNSGVRNFWTGLKSFVASFYQELKHGSKASDQEAWDLIRDMMASVFKNIHDVRSIARSVASGRVSLSADERIEKAALVIWGTVQAHRIMEEVTKAEFKRHACVVPSLTLFLFKHRAPTQMVVDSHSKLEASIAKLMKAFEAQEKEHNGLKGEFHKLKGLVDRKK